MRSLPLATLVLSLLLTAASDVAGKVNKKPASAIKPPGNTKPALNKKPNIIVIMVDDLGIGDVGCYGNDTISTPYMDKMAAEGVKLNQYISAAPICTPSRIAFLTGRYAFRAGMSGVGDVRVLLFLGCSGGLLPNQTTFAKRLQQQGYTTGIVGKWHVGVSCETREDHCHHPNQHGFTYFYGLPHTLFNDCEPSHGRGVMSKYEPKLKMLAFVLGLIFSALVGARMCGLFEVRPCLLAIVTILTILAIAMLYVPSMLITNWNCVLMRNEEVIEQPMVVPTLPQRLLGEAQKFIQRSSDGPFLLFLSMVHVHEPLFRSAGFTGRSRHGAYGDNVEEVDWMIGQVMETVDSLGLTNNTLIHVTSDHGGHLELPDRAGGSNGVFKGGKGMAGWEGGIRVPGLFRWPGRLPAGRVVDEPTSLMDLYPTLKYLAGDTQPDRLLDGHNLMPLLEGKATRSEHEFMFHYCGVYLNAVRWHPAGSKSVYKVHFFTPNFSPPGAGGCYESKVCGCHGDQVTHHNPPLIFDLYTDPSESRPLSPETEPRFTEILGETAKAVERHESTITKSPNAPYQMSSDKILWKPSLQPCCGTFPFCSCREGPIYM